MPPYHDVMMMGVGCHFMVDLSPVWIKTISNNSSERMTLLNIILIVALTIIFVSVSYFLLRNIENRKKKRLQFALLAFQSHTNPHFIKNVLQAINWFILNNEKNLASDYLCDFSTLMEDILKFSKKNFVTLAEKLKFLDLYLKLQHLRHKDKFDYIPLTNIGQASTIQVSEEINPDVFLLPPLLIHPYIENAIDHGLKPLSTKGKLAISFDFKNNKLICTVSDNGIGIAESKKIQAISKIKRSKIGIINTQKRIEIIRKLYGINIKVKIQDLNPGNENPGTSVILQFPMPLNFSPESGLPEEIYKV
jgi:sensor histidine kinase YesM